MGIPAEYADQNLIFCKCGAKALAISVRSLGFTAKRTTSASWMAISDSLLKSRANFLGKGSESLLYRDRTR